MIGVFLVSSGLGVGLSVEVQAVSVKNNYHTKTNIFDVSNFLGNIQPPKMH